MTELDLLADDLEVSGRTLRRAAARGAIRVHRPTPNAPVISSHERRYIHSHWQLLDALTRTLRTEKNVRLAVLFGSSARGDDRADSDVDLLVDLADYEHKLPIARLGLKLEEILGRRVQVVALRDAIAAPVLLAEAIRDGRVVIDRDERWVKLRRRERILRRQAREHDRHGQDNAWRVFDDLGTTS
jgi:predicted nucleotidyltransferase